MLAITSAANPLPLQILHVTSRNHNHSRPTATHTATVSNIVLRSIGNLQICYIQ